MDTVTDRRLEAPRDEMTAGVRDRAPVPASYAERAMNSLMSLHASLVAEKDRTLDLTRRLMEARQGQAELESYVRLLEAEVARLGGPDLREVHDRRGDALDRASVRVLDDLRRGPPVAPTEGALPVAAPPAPAPAPAAMAPSALAPAATTPPAPAPAAVAPRSRRVVTAPVPPPRPVPAPRRAAHVPEAPSRGSHGARPVAHRVPRPPRPSRRYRTKVTAPSPAAEVATPAPAPREDDGWRQW